MGYQGEGLQASQAELHKAFGRFFTSCSVFQNCLFLPRRVSSLHFQTLNEAAQRHLQMGKLRPGGADLPKTTQQGNSKHPANTTVLPSSRSGMHIVMDQLHDKIPLSSTASPTTLRCTQLIYCNQLKQQTHLSANAKNHFAKCVFIPSMLHCNLSFP